MIRLHRFTYLMIEDLCDKTAIGTSERPIATRCREQNSPLQETRNKLRYYKPKVLTGTISPLG